MFLGIDHSAIAVSNTPASLAFYRDLLGFDVAGNSLNVGMTQAHLDNLFNAKVNVTSLAPSEGGLGVELLDYLTPPGGRPMPVDQQSNDLVHVQLELVVKDLDRALSTLTDAQVQLVTPEPVELSDGPFQRGLLIRDPDGHNMMLVEP